MCKVPPTSPPISPYVIPKNISSLGRTDTHVRDDQKNCSYYTNLFTSCLSHCWRSVNYSCFKLFTKQDYSEMSPANNKCRNEPDHHKTIGETLSIKGVTGGTEKFVYPPIYQEATLVETTSFSG